MYHIAYTMYAPDFVTHAHSSTDSERSSAARTALGRMLAALVVAATGLALSTSAPTVHATPPPNLNWIAWESPGSFPGSSSVIQPGGLPYDFDFASQAIGTISAGTPVYVTFEGEIAWDGPGLNKPSDFGVPTSTYWSGRPFTNSATTYISPNVPSLPPNGDRIGVVGSSVSAQTLRFYSDAARTVPANVSNIVMNIYSLGAPGGPGAWDFDRQFSILSDNRTSGGTGFTKTAPTANTYRLSASEGSGTIQFNGSFTSISWTVTQAEAFAAWNIGMTSVDPPLDVTFDTQGGSTISAQTTAVGGSLTDPGTPTRDGHTFAGWFISSTGGTPITFPYAHGQSAAFTLYAQWRSDAQLLPPPPPPGSAAPATSAPTTSTTEAPTTTSPVTNAPAASTPASSTTGGVPQGVLPETGSDDSAVIWAAVILASGVLLAATARRRTRPT